MSEWQPIETAPRGKRILLFRPTASQWSMVMGGMYNGDEYAKKPNPYWSADNWNIGKPYLRNNPPTHWMPLPEPPK